MNKRQALNLTKELSLNKVSPQSSMALVPSNPQNRISQGYQLHINKPLNLQNQMIIQSIAQKHHLAIFKNTDKTILYKPILLEQTLP